jgi:hypothetical protein
MTLKKFVFQSTKLTLHLLFLFPGQRLSGTTTTEKNFESGLATKFESP